MTSIYPFDSFFFISIFFFNDTATTEIYTLSLHDALPILPRPRPVCARARHRPTPESRQDRKSTRLNSSHVSISYAVFCLKKKKNTKYSWLICTKKNTCKHKPYSRTAS